MQFSVSSATGNGNYVYLVKEENVSYLYMGRAKRVWYLSPMRAAKVQASLRIRAVSPEPPLLAHTSRESRGTFRQKTRFLTPLNGWACAVKICHFVMTECSKTQIRLTGLILRVYFKYSKSISWKWYYHKSPVKLICVFEHSVMTNFNCTCPAIQRGQGSGFLSEGSSWFTACMSEQRRFWRDCTDAQARLNLRCSHRR